MAARAKRNTRERILAKALELFNAQGTGAVTTNHIAAALGISPGNLYYYFRNREEIIRHIFAQMDQESRAGFMPIIQQAQRLGLEVFEETFRFIQQFNKRFLFFKRELASLLLRDAELRRQFTVVHQDTLALIHALIDNVVAAGVLRPMTEQERTLLAEMSWMLTLFWPQYLEVVDEHDFDAGLERGIAMVRLLIHEFRIDR